MNTNPNEFRDTLPPDEVMLEPSGQFAADLRNLRSAVQSAAERSGSRPYYTAFPSLTARETKEERDKNFEFPPMPVIGADAPTLRKIQFEQLQAAVTYAHRIEERIRIGAYSPDEFLVFLAMSAKMIRLAAELEETALDQVATTWPAADVDYCGVLLNELIESEAWDVG